MTLSQREAARDAGYRSLASAIILRAVRDSAEPEAFEFLVSPECKALARLAGVRWQVTADDIPPAAAKLQRRRRRHPARRRTA